MRRIGITLRNSAAHGYPESRDALARDWYRLFREIGWHNNWLLIPNIGTDAVNYLKTWQIDGLIFSGGDDIGIDLQRDITERALLEYARMKHIPVLGVCRGMQLMLLSEYGRLSQDPSHVATPHQITLNPAFPWKVSPQQLFPEVNSFHSNIITFPLPTTLESIASTENSCEAFRHHQLPWLGIMWHPEREEVLQDFNRALFKWLFG